MTEEIVTSVFEFGNTIFTNGLIWFLIRAVILYAIMRQIRKLLDKAIARRMEADADSSMALHFLSNICNFGIKLLTAILILQDVIPLSKAGAALLGATSVISVVIGLAAQATFGNFIAGFFLAVYHPFKIGDLVYMNDGSRVIEGHVESITFRHTVIRTWENTKLIIPNSVMNNTTIENRNPGEDNVYTRFITFDIAYESDPEVAARLIREAVAECDEVIDTRTAEEKLNHVDAVWVRVEEFDESGIRLKFPLHTNDYGSNLHAASEIRKKLLISFRENNIEIPYNKVEVVGKN